jgi:hypothetical protein
MLLPPVLPLLPSATVADQLMPCATDADSLAARQAARQSLLSMIAMQLSPSVTEELLTCSV